MARWRRALGVGPATPGTLQLRHATEPDRRAKIAAAKRGQPRPRHVIEAMREANRGRPASAETRARMSAAHQARGTRPPAAGVPWTAAEDEAVRTLPAPEAAKATGRTLTAVYSRRLTLGLPDGRRRRAD